jgi:hypothetical protein
MTRLPRYHIYALVGREATVKLAAARAPGAEVVPLRFGLAGVPLTDAVVAALGGDGAEPPFIEFVKLTAAAAAWVREASMKGPIAYVEAEHSDGAGWHAAVAWRGGDRLFGPQHVEGRGPVNEALRQLGVVATQGLDEFDTLDLASLC